MKVFKITASLILIFLLCIACNNEKLVIESNENDDKLINTDVQDDIISDYDIPLLNIEGVVWTRDEIEFIEKLHEKGSIKIATKVSSAVYAPQADGTIKGFHYNVVNEFATLLEVKIDIQLVEWKDYFYKEGEEVDKVKIDPNYSYVPSLIEEVDLYIDGITSLPWREKMFDIIKFIPSKQLIVSRKDNIPLSLEDLNNQTCSLVKDTSMELNLKSIVKELDLNVRYKYGEDFSILVKEVADSTVDFTVLDSDAAFASTYKYDNLTVAMPISEIQIMGWGIHKSDVLLKNVISKYLIYAQDSKILDKYWVEEYGVSFIDYLKILQLE